MLPWPIMVLPTILMREWEERCILGVGRGERLRHNASASILSPVLGGKWKSMSVIGSLDPEGSPSQPSVA